MNYKKIILGIAFLAVFGLLFVPTGPAVKAMTEVETKALIAQLQQQIAQLMEQIEQLQGTITTTTWCHTFNANIGMGQKTGNPEIDALKTALEKEGLYDSASAVSSDDSDDSDDSKGYDEALASAVTGFQEKYASEILTPYNLKHGTGFVGKATRAKLNALYGCKTKQKIRPNNCTEEYAPVCGKNGKTYSNKCLAKNAGTEVDYEGKCITPTNKPPVTKGISGPTTLNVGQIGTWTINASDPENGTLTYSVIWNDEPAYSSMIENGLGSGDYGQTATFTHSYSTAGIYVPKFYVKDDAGQTATASISVNVGATITPYVKILSPNGGEIYKIGDSITVNWKTVEVSSSHKISLIRLRAQTNGQEYNLAYDVLNDGQEIITIPSSVPAGAYTLEIKTYVDNVLVFDASDSYFKIVETTPSITCTGQNASNFDYYTKGTVSWITASGITGSMTDFCSNDNVLVKYYCDPTSGYNYKNNEYTCPNGCSNGACNRQPSSVTLNYVKIDGSNLKVSYNKNFDTCVHLLDRNNKILHAKNWFCQKGDNVETSASLSDFTVTAGQEVKLCHGNNYNICSDFVAIAQPSITVLTPNGGETWQIGSSQKITWTTNNIPIYPMTIFFNSEDGYTHYQYNYVGDVNPNVGSIDIVVPSALTSGNYKIEVRTNIGDQIYLDTSDNYFSIVPACKYAILDDNRDGAVVRAEGEEVIRRVQAIIGSRLGDANFVADFDTTGDGIISLLDSLRLINDLNICAPSAPTALAPSANDQLLASISDAIARMVEIIKEMLKR